MVYAARLVRAIKRNSISSCSDVLAFAGGLSGIVVARAGVSALLKFVPQNLKLRQLLVNRHLVIVPGNAVHVVHVQNTTQACPNLRIERRLLS